MGTNKGKQGCEDYGDERGGGVAHALNELRVSQVAETFS